MSVDFKRKDYLAELPVWTMLDDLSEGERAVHSGGERYLPRPSPEDDSETNIARYQVYLKRATYYNYLGATLGGLIGAALLKEPEVEFTGFLEIAGLDINGQGVSAAQQAQKALSMVLLKGRALLWGDYPRTEGEASVADMQSGKIRPVVHLIEPERVINWRTIQVGAEHRLGLVVFEATEIVANGYEQDEEKRLYVLRLDAIDGVYAYNVEVHKQDGGAWTLAESFVPLNSKGETLDYIPALFLGAENNDPEVDDSPLLDLAYLNLHHYQNSADYEESVHFTGQVQPYISGLTQDWVDENYAEGVILGSKRVLVLPDGGEFGYAQAQPNTLVAEAMDKKRDAMVELGARIMTKGSANRVVADAESDREKDHSILSLAVTNINAGYAQAAEWLVDFAGSGSALLELNDDFVFHKLGAQDLLALVSAWQAGAIPQSELIRKLKQAGVIDAEKSVEDVLEELADQVDGLGLEAIVSDVA